jgi:hypothetical protein
MYVGKHGTPSILGPQAIGRSNHFLSEYKKGLVSTPRCRLGHPPGLTYINEKFSKARRAVETVFLSGALFVDHSR